MSAENVEKADIVWLDARDPQLGMRGLFWMAENGGGFSRLPERAKALVREPVWDLAQQPAGACLAFCSTTSSLWVRLRVKNTSIMSHMPATGSDGMALYVGSPGHFRPCSIVRPMPETPQVEQALFEGMESKNREFRLYLPLYKEVEEIQIGFSPDSLPTPASPPRLEKPMVIYGTSITQGGCSSNPGSDFAAVAARQLNLDLINLGFSGNGQGEPELAELMAEIDAAVYILDYAANTQSEAMRQNLPEFIRILRERRPLSPILLVSQIYYPRYEFNPVARQEIEAKRDVILDVYIQCRHAGDLNIHFADGFDWLPYGASGVQVDGCHPTDHGFALMAARLASTLQRLLFLDPGV